LLWFETFVDFMKLTLDLAVVDVSAGLGWTSIKQAQTESEGT
jgi:hypothetical protein